jgi:hypothetical protein
MLNLKVMCSTLNHLFNVALHSHCRFISYTILRWHSKLLFDVNSNKRTCRLLNCFMYAWGSVIFISIFFGSTSCDFQWSDRTIYIHEFGWTMLEVDEITFIHLKMEWYHLKIWEHFSDFTHSEIGNLSLKFPFVLLLSNKSPKKITLLMMLLLGSWSRLGCCTFDLGSSLALSWQNVFPSIVFPLGWIPQGSAICSLLATTNCKLQLLQKRFRIAMLQRWQQSYCVTEDGIVQYWLQCILCHHQWSIRTHLSRTREHEFFSIYLLRFILMW